MRKWATLFPIGWVRHVSQQCINVCDNYRFVTVFGFIMLLYVHLFVCYWSVKACAPYGDCWDVCYHKFIDVYDKFSLWFFPYISYVSNTNFSIKSLFINFCNKFVMLLWALYCFSYEHLLVNNSPIILHTKNSTLYTSITTL